MEMTVGLSNMKIITGVEKGKRNTNRGRLATLEEDKGVVVRCYRFSLQNTDTEK